MKRLLLPSLFLSATLSAAVSPNALFSDGMVLQRGQPVPVWGAAAPGEKVLVEFGAVRAEATADADGSWSVTLPAMEASEDGRPLVIRAGNTVTVSDVVVGDVWLASGQSNMASPLSSGSAAEALPQATDPMIRFFTVAKAVAAEPKGTVSGRWDRSTPERARNFSAVAYFFARELRAAQRVPIGVINSSWGGTPIKTWMPLSAIQQEPRVVRVVSEWETALRKHLETRDRPELMEAYYRDMKEWETTIDAPFRAARREHEAAAAAARAAGQPVPPSPRPARPEPEMPNPIAMPSASKRPNVPTITYNAMIAPLAPYALKGVIWYQGEADISRSDDYMILFPGLIGSWRESFRTPLLPFLFVQLPANGRDAEPVAPTGTPFLREAQAFALGLKGTAMAVTLDIGDPGDVHPDNKVHVGERLALAARQHVYGEKVEGTSPRYLRHEMLDGAVRIQFTNTGGGLAEAEAPWRPAKAQPPPKGRILGFHISGADRKWHAADARIDGDSVVVSSASVPDPVAVRYGWAHSPKVNLYGLNGLPVAPFRTDTPMP